MQWGLFTQGEQALPEQVNAGFAGIQIAPLINIYLASVATTVLGTGVPE